MKTLARYAYFTLIHVFALLGFALLTNLSGFTDGFVIGYLETSGVYVEDLRNILYGFPL